MQKDHAPLGVGRAEQHHGGHFENTAKVHGKPDMLIQRWWENTLETSGEDVKLLSKRVEKMWNYTRNGGRRCETTLERSGEVVKLHSKGVEKM